MQIDIYTRNFALTDALRSHAEQRLQCALSGFEDRIKLVVMQLSDLDVPHDGADKRCLLWVVLPGMTNVVTEDTETSLYLAIDHAADRAKRAVKRRTHLQQTIPMQTSRSHLRLV
jgi:ribosomal subunit interface protein